MIFYRKTVSSRFRYQNNTQFDKKSVSFDNIDYQLKNEKFLLFLNLLKFGNNTNNSVF